MEEVKDTQNVSGSTVETFHYKPVRETSCDKRRDKKYVTKFLSPYTQTKCSFQDVTLLEIHNTILIIAQTGNPDQTFILNKSISGRVKRALQLIQTSQSRGGSGDSSDLLFTFRRMDPEGSQLSPDGETPTLDHNPKYQRKLKSLHLLATKFIRLLQEAEDGVLDLKDVSGDVSLYLKNK